MRSEGQSRRLQKAVEGMDAQAAIVRIEGREGKGKESVGPRALSMGEGPAGRRVGEE